MELAEKGGNLLKFIIAKTTSLEAGAEKTRTVTVGVMLAKALEALRKNDGVDQAKLVDLRQRKGTIDELTMLPYKGQEMEADAQSCRSENARILILQLIKPIEEAIRDKKLHVKLEEAAFLRSLYDLADILITAIGNGEKLERPKDILEPDLEKFTPPMAEVRDQVVTAIGIPMQSQNSLSGGFITVNEATVKQELQRPLGDTYLDITRAFPATIMSLQELLSLTADPMSDQCRKFLSELTIEVSGNKLLGYKDIAHFAVNCFVEERKVGQHPIWAFKNALIRSAKATGILLERFELIWREFATTLLESLEKTQPVATATAPGVTASGITVRPIAASMPEPPERLPITPADLPRRPGRRNTLTVSGIALAVVTLVGGALKFIPSSSASDTRTPIVVPISPNVLPATQEETPPDSPSTPTPESTPKTAPSTKPSSAPVTTQKQTSVQPVSRPSQKPPTEIEAALSKKGPKPPARNRVFDAED